MRRIKVATFTALVLTGFAATAAAQSPRVLYTWAGTGNTQEWAKGFGDNAVTLENSTDGDLTVRETGGAGTSFAVADGANKLFEGEPGQGGLDLTGLEALEIEIGHGGAGPVNVQFYVQATPAFTYVALGPDQAIEPGVATYRAPLDGLAPDQIAYIRVIGVNVREHPDEGDLVWTLREVRSAGTPLKRRVYADHEPGSSDGGLQGAFVNFETTAVEGNDGGQNQSGLRHNTSPSPPGNTGSLQWVDLASGNGAAVTWANGTVYQGNSFNERPTDMSSYARVVLRMAATPVEGGFVESVGVQYFLQTGAGFQFSVAGGIQGLPADGEYHDLVFDTSAIARLDFVNTHGVNLQSHGGGDVVIDVDELRAEAADAITDCNSNGREDARDLVDGASEDCNENLVPDECDIAAGRSEDCDASGTPDECDIAGVSRTRVLYTWEGTGDHRGWMKSFGANDFLIENSTEGELTVTEVGAEGTTGAVSDDFNVIAEGAPATGGLDLTGMSAIAIDLAHSGPGPVQVQFYVQATPAFTYVALGPDVAVGPEPATYVLPLEPLSAGETTYIRAIGMNIREHLAEGNVVWTIREVRAAGVPLTQRDYATHEPGSSDGGLQGAIVAFENLAVEGNDGGANQMGLRHNTSASPPGNTGSLQWTDLPGQGGGAIAWFNGTAFGGDTFNERPTDMSPYTEIAVRMAATNVIDADVASVDVTYFLETGGFHRQDAGPAQPLEADGRFHLLVFPTAGIPDLSYVDAHGIDLQEHPDGAVVIDVDSIRALARSVTPNDCNANRIPDACDVRSGVLHDADRDGVPDECETEPGFRRGDSDSNGALEITDAIRTLGWLFLGGLEPSCPDAADTDDSGKIDISDAIRGLNYLFSGGAEPPAPGPRDCGQDPTDDDLGACEYPEGLCA